ncbi:hypothetical protein OG552_10490 [Streptomyces sp. NBC_01476]|uniref:hypothetical protein n=1 Tax=Streptomyces sp. NBC_01476 TaxID=2903881 RepID=UPI002E2F0457|nr:hypothetical protein [Streptomyces sp. NBC_01476]
MTAQVAAAITAESGKPVGLGKMPRSDDGVTPVLPPYHILYSIDSTFDGAPFTDENEDAHLVYQVTSVSGPDPEIPQSGGDQTQTEWLADKARIALLGRNPTTGAWLHNITAPGYQCMSRGIDIEPGAVPDPADGIMSYVQRFRFDLTPTT